uniref:holo-[acyl-carrier-protein] synthase n=1 Tax=Lotharella oceanica TaxID=641309 RepID=A0A7S2XDX2_9EUKA|mmetsp:Transcript_30597/g.57164  ORF Transcript_30597/g.57164 Transcript_30597/m.57164 type:complete len:172 (+) Transcript_30597:372-887(+)
MVDTAEKQKIHSLHWFEDARARLAGQLLIRHLACSVLGICPTTLTRQVTERLDSGRPVIIGAPKNFEFSIAHDGNWVVLEAGLGGLAGETPLIGCDVVNTLRETKIERLPRVFTPEEWEQVRAVDDPDGQRIRLMRRWAVKEAVVKALGVGIKFGMNNVHVSLTGEPSHET